MTEEQINPTIPDSMSDETLDITIARAAEGWSEEDRLVIITGLRALRVRWNAEQTKGSKKRITSNKIKAPKSEIQRLAAGLKNITL